MAGCVNAEVMLGNQRYVVLVRSTKDGGWKRKHQKVLKKTKSHVPFNSSIAISPCLLEELLVWPSKISQHLKNRNCISLVFSSPIKFPFTVSWKRTIRKACRKHLLPMMILQTLLTVHAGWLDLSAYGSRN